MVVEGAFNLLFRPGLRKDFRDTFEMYKPEYPLYLKVSTTDMPEQQASIITGPSRMFELADGAPVSYDDPKLGPKVVGVDKEYGLGFVITRRAVEDDQYNKANQAAKWLAHAARMTMEYRSALFLDDAFTGTYFKGIDGKKLCATDHTLINSTSTWANTPSTQVGLSVTGITNLIDLATIQVDQNGDPRPMNCDTLVIGTNTGDQNRALQIWHSKLEPFTSDNQENALKLRMGMANGNMPRKDPIVSHFKSSRRSYFLIDSRYNDAHFVIRRDVQMEDTHDFDTGAAKYKTTCRFLVWFVDPIGWYGCNPS